MPLRAMPFRAQSEPPIEVRVSGLAASWGVSCIGLRIPAVLSRGVQPEPQLVGQCLPPNRLGNMVADPWMEGRISGIHENPERGQDLAGPVVNWLHCHSR